MRHAKSSQIGPRDSGFPRVPSAPFSMPPSPLARLRKVCLKLPEADEVEAWGDPTFRVKNKIFAMYAHANNHHGGGRHAVWCKASPINQTLMIDAAPDRFFKPPYVGPSGWIGVWLDGKVDWTELPYLQCDAYIISAPRQHPTLLNHYFGGLSS